MIDHLLKPQQVAEYLGITVKMVHQLCREHKLPYVKINRKERRFTEEQVQEYVDSQTVKIPVIDKKPSKRLDCPRKGGEKSFGNGANLRKEMKQWR